MNEVSRSHEDYLETIVELGGTTAQSVRSVDIANHLGVSKASVNKAISLLKEKGYVVQPYYGDVTLTKEGFDYAKSVRKRHDLLYAFLTQELGISAKVAEDEACQMEHAISDSSYKKWIAYFKKIGLSPKSQTAKK